MIINKLKVLLTEHGETASSISHKTGIARSTLSALSTNSSKMVQFDTINKLCQQLEITPADFFEYTPIDFDFSFDFSDEKYSFRDDSKEKSIKNINVDGFLDCNLLGKKETMNLQVTIRKTRPFDVYDKEMLLGYLAEIGPADEKSKQISDNYIKPLSLAFKNELNKQCCLSLKDFYKNNLNEMSDYIDPQKEEKFKQLNYKVNLYNHSN